MRLLRALSLDVVAGAACGGLLAESVTGVRMLPAWWIALLTAVWSIYTGDHLLDARRSLGPLATYRHTFHRDHAGVLSVALAGAVVAGLTASLGLRPPVQKLGFALTALVLLYLVSAQGLLWPRLPKEPVAGLLYAVGIWSGPLVMSERPFPGPMIAALLQALAALLNLAAFAVFEAPIDRQHGTRSVSLRWGTGRVRQAVVVTGFAGALGALGVGMRLQPGLASAWAVIAAQIVWPGVMLMGSGWFGRHERYRSWGDGVFLLGALPRLLS